MISFSWLTLSVTFGATSPKGRGLGNTHSKAVWCRQRLPLRGSWQSRRL